MMFYYKWISLSLICLQVTIILEIITFSANNWLHTTNESNRIRFGMWYVCDAAKCSSWFDDSRLVTVTNYALNSSYRSFLAFQVIFLVLTTTSFILLTIVFIVFVLKRINLFIFLIVNALLVVGAAVAGTISLIVFGTSVYDANLHRLDWCYWLSVAAVVIVLYSGISMIALAIKANTLSHEEQQKYLNYSMHSTASTLRTDRSKQSKEGILDYKKFKNSTVNSVQKPTSAPTTKKTASTVTSSLERQNKNRIKSAPSGNILLKNSSVQTSISVNTAIQTDTTRSRNPYNKRTERQTRSAKSVGAQQQRRRNQEQFVNIGYASDPESNSRSLERSIQSTNTFDKVTQINEVVERGHLKRLPFLVYYDGTDYYGGPDPVVSAAKLVRNSKFINTKPVIDLGEETSPQVYRF